MSEAPSRADIPPEGCSRDRPRACWLKAGGAALVHAGLGLALLPRWMFAKYPDVAALLAAGRLSPDEGADVSPLYLLVNLVLSPQSLRVAQSVLGAFAVLAVFFLARRLFGAVAGWAGLALACVAAPLLLYEATLEPDLPIAACNVGALALLSWSERVGAQGAARAGAAAALFGLSAALRPSNLPLVLVAALWLAWDARSAGWRAGARRAALALACGGVAVAAPVAGVRASVGPQLAATMSVGEVVHICNRPEGSGLGYQSPGLIKLLEQQEASHDKPDSYHALSRRFARAERGASLTPFECERFWIQKAGAFVRQEPGAWLSLAGRKAVYFLTGPDAHDVAEVRQAQRGLPAPPFLGFRGLTALGTAGLALAVLRRRKLGATGPYLGVAMALAVAFCVTSRHTLVMIPVWCALGGFFASELASALRSPRKLAGLALAAAVPVGLSFAPVLRDGARTVERAAAAGAAVGDLERALRAGEGQNARLAFVQAQAAQPLVRLTRDLRGVPFESPALALESAAESERRFGAGGGADAYFLARLWMHAGRCDLAVPLAEQSAEAGFYSAVWDVSLDPELLIAECLLARGERSGASERVDRALRRRPGTLTGLSWAAAAARGRGEAHSPAEQTLFALHDALSAHLALSTAFLAWGEPEAALERADRVLQDLPELGVAHYQRARALAALGRANEALTEYAEALQRHPAHSFDTGPFESILQTALGHPGAPPEMNTLAVDHAIRAGRMAEARQRLELAGTGEAPRSTHLRQVSEWLARRPVR